MDLSFCFENDNKYRKLTQEVRSEEKYIPRGGHIKVPSIEHDIADFKRMIKEKPNDCLKYIQRLIMYQLMLELKNSRVYKKVVCEHGWNAFARFVTCNECGARIWIKREGGAGNVDLPCKNWHNE